ncbi:dienelactone hydrolase family protein [Sarocladium implicatum]|nr:dienelactone hydrolase family protein [Sarocladium implicatum]
MKFSIAAALCLSALSHAFSIADWIDSTIAHDGDPVGKEIDYDGLTLYVTKPTCKPKPTIVLYLTDVFGVNLTENKLLSDSFARAGFITVTPDLFDGEPAPADLNAPGFNATEFLAAHGPDVTDPKVEKAIEYIKTTYGDEYALAITGYCFGGRYAFRFVAEGKGGDVAFTAHPSLLTDDEVLDITKPASIAAAELDEITPTERRRQIEDLLLEAAQPYEVAVYSGTMHGFGVRANVSDPEQKYGKETAFLQAVHWFESWA